jgi:hypothetical protein
MPKKSKQKISQKVIQNVIVKVGEMKKKRKARRRAKRQARDSEGVSSFRQGTTIPPMVTYQTSPTQFTPFMPKEFEDVYRTVKSIYGKKEAEPSGFMDLKPVAQPLRRPTKEVLEDKEIVTPVSKASVSTNTDDSNISKQVIFTDNIKDKPLSYETPSLNIFPQTNINNVSTITELAHKKDDFLQKNIIKAPLRSQSAIDIRAKTPSREEARMMRLNAPYMQSEKKDIIIKPKEIITEPKDIMTKVEEAKMKEKIKSELVIGEKKRGRPPKNAPLSEEDKSQKKIEFPKTK